MFCKKKKKQYWQVLFLLYCINKWFFTLTYCVDLKHFYTNVYGLPEHYFKGSFWIKRVEKRLAKTMRGQGPGFVYIFHVRVFRQGNSWSAIEIWYGRAGTMLAGEHANESVSVPCFFPLRLMISPWLALIIFPGQTCQTPCSECFGRKAARGRGAWKADLRSLDLIYSSAVWLRVADSFMFYTLRIKIKCWAPEWLVH